MGMVNHIDEVHLGRTNHPKSLHRQLDVYRVCRIKHSCAGNEILGRIFCAENIELKIRLSAYRSPQVVLDLVGDGTGAQSVHRSHVTEEEAPEARVPKHLPEGQGQTRQDLTP